MADIASLCTIITTTSPTPSNPSVELISETLQSLDQAPELLECRNIVVCDGHRTADAPKYRSGVVTDEGARAYEEYVASLEGLAQQALQPYWRHVRIVRLQGRHGFGYAVRAALQLVETPFVCVLQHDRSFTRQFSRVRDLLAAMQSDQRLKMVGLPTTSNDPSKYEKFAVTKLQRMQVQHPPFESLVVAPPECPGLRLIPLLMWHDSTHFASTTYYRDFVFGERDLVSKGGFIEDKLGQQQGNDLRTLGWGSHEEYGTWLLDDGAAPPTRMVGHLNGKRFVDHVERSALEARKRAETPAKGAAPSTEPSSDTEETVFCLDSHQAEH